MAQFKFRLAALLALRQRIKDEKQWQLAALSQARQAVEAEIVSLEGHLTQLDQSMSVSVGALVSAIDLKLASDAAQGVVRRIDAKRLQLGQLDNAIAGKTAELVEARREVMALERLRERQAEQFRDAQDAIEQKFTDEVAQRKFARGAGRKEFPH